MLLYNDHKTWEEAWKRPWTPDSPEFARRCQGDGIEQSGVWTVSIAESDRDGIGRVFIGGQGATKAEAVHDCWENYLNYFSPQDVYEHVLLLKARNAFPAKYGHWIIKGWDDQDEAEKEGE